MKKEQTITIWEGCDPYISEAIERFQDRWRPYSTASRRYPIVRLIQEVIDPAIATYMNALPARYSGFVSGVGAGMDFSETIRLVGFDTMVRLQRQLLRHFIKTVDRQDSRDQRFVVTVESLTSLVWDCACKRPKKTTTTTSVNLNAQRKHGFCELCGELTEFADFMATVADDQVNDVELQDRKKLELSHQSNSATSTAPGIDRSWRMAAETPLIDKQSDPSRNSTSNLIGSTVSARSVPRRKPPLATR